MEPNVDGLDAEGLSEEDQMAILAALSGDSSPAYPLSSYTGTASAASQSSGYGRMSIKQEF